MAIKSVSIRIEEEMLEKLGFVADYEVETVAGATVTSHCGENTIGIIYYNDAK